MINYKTRKSRILCYTCRYFKTVYSLKYFEFFICNHPKFIFKINKQEKRNYLTIFDNYCKGKYWKNGTN